MMTEKLEIDYETADRIALLALKDHRKYVKKELKAHKKGAWMHPEDVVYNTQLLEALDVVIHYYGG
jgi:hypothetical protein